MSASEERCPDCLLPFAADSSALTEPDTCACAVHPLPIKPFLDRLWSKAGVIIIDTHPGPRIDVAGNAGSLSVAERTRETVFTVRVRHPSDDDPTWTALVDGPDGAFDVGVAGNPDEALSQVIDTIALHDFGSDGDDDRYRP